MWRLLTSEVNTHHDHADDPEEYDVVSGLQQRSGVEVLEVGSLLRPAHC